MSSPILPETPKHRLPNGIHADARNFETLLRADKSPRERAALEIAMIDALREAGISLPFMTYPREAFLAVFRRWAAKRPPPLRIRDAEHTWDQATCPLMWAAHRLQLLVHYLLGEHSLNQYESAATECAICSALLHRVARAGIKAELANYAVPNTLFNIFDKAESDTVYAHASLGESTPISIQVGDRTFGLGSTDDDSILDADSVG